MDAGHKGNAAALELEELLSQCLAPYSDEGWLPRKTLLPLLKDLLPAVEESRVESLLDGLLEDCANGSDGVAVESFVHWAVAPSAGKGAVPSVLSPTARSKKAVNLVRKVNHFRTKEQSQLLGVSVHFLATHFLGEVEAHFGAGADPNYHEINPRLFWGPNARGRDVTCPRDGRIGASYADSIDPAHTGPATVMLSWTWNYTARTVVTALARWCERARRDAKATFVWQCALCINQFRVQEKEAAHQEENFESFRSVFESRVRSTGHILALLSPWHNPQYLTRIWCVFELWVACERKDVTLEVIMSEEAEEQFHASLAASGMISVWKAFGCVQIQKAKASVLADRQNILRLVEPEATKDEDYDSSSKVQKLNEAVVRHLHAWCADAAADHVEAALTFNETLQPQACANTAWLLMEVADWTRAMAILVEGRKALERAGKEGSVEDAWLLKNMGSWYADLGKYAEGMEHYRMAKAAMKKSDAATTAEYARLLRNMGKSIMRQGHLDSAMGYFKEAQEAFIVSNATNTPQYAVFLRTFGFCHGELGSLEEALTLYEEAKDVFEKTKASSTPNYAGLLMDMGRLKMTAGELDAAMELFTASRSAFQLAGAEQTRNFADLLHCLGDCLDEQGKHDEAFRIFKQAQHVFELCGLSKTTNYAELLANMADCMKKQGLEKDSAQVLNKASTIFVAADASPDVLEHMSPLERRRHRVDKSRSPSKKLQVTMMKTQPAFHMKETTPGA